MNPTDPREEAISNIRARANPLQLQADLDEANALSARLDAEVRDIAHRLSESQVEVHEAQSTNSNLAAEIAELKEELEHYGSVAEWMGKPTSDLHTELIRLRAELEATRKERDEVCKELEAQVETTHTALAAKDAAEKERNEAREVLRQIATLDCGCVPCTGQCRTGRAAEIELESRMELARAALTPAPTQEPPACPKCFGTGWIRQVGGKLKCECKQEPPAGGVVESKNDYPGVELGSAIINVDTGELVSPADVPSEGRGEWMPFNLSNALAGKPVVTRSGRKVSRIKVGDGIIDAWTTLGDSFTVWSHGGYRFNKNAHPLDLFMLPPEGSGA